MRLSTRIHGMLDYLVGVVLLAAPWVFGFGLAGPAGWVPFGVGIALIVNALATDFEMGRLRALQIPVHLWIDGLLGLLLAVSPWLLGFDRTAWVPHLAVGVLVVLIAFVTNTVPGYDRRRVDPAAAG